MPDFDHNATTPLHPEAEAAWLRASREGWQNPSSPYESGARVRRWLEEARAELAELLGCGPERIVFNSGATEGLNAVVRYLASGSDGSAVAWPMEHPCVMEALRAYFPERVEWCPVSADGVADSAGLAASLDKDPAFVALMAANNETGVLQPWETVWAACREAGVAFVCDAAQWLGKLPATGLAACDFLVGDAHKFGGPKGVGFLVLPESARIFSSQPGGGQESGRRGGTENLPGVVAMVTALRVRTESCEAENTTHQAALRDRFEAVITRSIPGLKIVGAGAPRLPNTSLVLAPRHANTRWISRLDRRGFSVGAGSACATGKNEPSHVLTAIGVEMSVARRAIRVSAAPDTPAGDWEALAEAFTAIWHDLEADVATGASTVIDI